MKATYPPLRVVVVLNTNPRSGIDPTGWRSEQICKEFLASNAETRLLLNGPPDISNTLYGRTLETSGSDSSDWWKANRGEIFVFCGDGSDNRAVLLCREHNPEATIIVDRSALLVLQRPDLNDDLTTKQELAGRDTVSSLRRQRDRELIALADQIWVYSDKERTEIEALTVETTVKVVRPPDIRLDEVSGSRPLLLAAPHREFGEPDLESVQYFNQQILPALDTGAEPPLLLTERSFGPWHQDMQCVETIERNGPLSEACQRASMVISLRQNGGTAWTHLLAAKAFRLPIIATPHAAAHVDDPATWDLHIVERAEIASTMARVAGRRRVPARPEPQKSGISEAIQALNIKAAKSESEITDWLLASALGQRHRMDLKQYRRNEHEALLDPDPDPGTSLDYRPLISIITPVYKTPLDVLEATINSVRTQTYENWQLCLVDDFSKTEELRTLCRQFTSLDSRINFLERSENGGIAVASNSALDMAEGEYIALLDHDDLLRSDALTEVVRAINRFPQVEFLYSDEDKLFADGSYDHSYAKSGWSPDLHLSYNYVCHFAVFSRDLLHRIGGWRLGFDGAQDYDLALRATETANEIVHIPRNLYHWRVLPGSTSGGVDQKNDAWDAGQRALSEALTRRGIAGKVEEGIDPGTYNIHYPVIARPKVGIIIPTRDRYELISQCVQGVIETTNGLETEILVVNNESTDQATLDWMDQHNGPVIDYPHQFSYARMMNMAAEQIDCDFLLFLNCDITIASPNWLEAMIGHAQQRRVGAVGAKLSFPDGRIQHEGITVGVGGVAVNTNSRGYFSIGNLTRNCWALTAACLMIRPEVFGEVGGFEERLRVAFNDVDLTMRIHQLGYDLVYQPHAMLHHQESALRGSLHPTEDEEFFRARWGEPLTYNDPYYNPRFSRHAQYYFADEVKQVWLPKGHPLA